MPMLCELSRMITPGDLGLAEDVALAFERMAGRASASASNASSRQRSASRIMSSIRIRRWFCSTLFWRNRIAAQTTLEFPPVEQVDDDRHGHRRQTGEHDGIEEAHQRVVVRSRNARYALNTSCSGCAVFTSM